jgi:hypothetical protein
MAGTNGISRSRKRGHSPPSRAADYLLHARLIPTSRDADTLKARGSAPLPPVLEPVADASAFKSLEVWRPSLQPVPCSSAWGSGWPTLEESASMLVGITERELCFNYCASHESICRDCVASAPHLRHRVRTDRRMTKVLARGIRMGVLVSRSCRRSRFGACPPARRLVQNSASLRSLFTSHTNYVLRIRNALRERYPTRCQRATTALSTC